ncbi:hypothetical protein HPB51_008149 [Rhipicephalus microplus]|uniref:Uncharacterized protein n=1 Tax=Rhipicephalus microplus TaxID=6941 RepID=A0A9J6D423_RHIMP|nr:hypothetical protein HPB51_008149 [Rhipicephalus microplus]
MAVVLFDGLKLPNYAICRFSLLRRMLYKRQNDVCYECGRFEHRADVFPTPKRRCAEAVGSSLHPTITSVCENVPFVEDHYILRRIKRVKKAFKFLTSCDEEDNQAKCAPERLNKSWPRRAGHGIPACQVVSGGGVSSCQLAVGAAAPGSTLNPGCGSRKSLPGPIEQRQSQWHCHQRYLGHHFRA